MSTSQSEPYQGYPYMNPGRTEAPVVNPSDVTNWDHLPRRPLRQKTDGQPQTPKQPVKKDSQPVVYIDLQDMTGSTVSEGRDNDGNSSTGRDGNSSTSRDEAQGDFVQDTILYNPFEDTRITVPDTPDSGHGSTVASEPGPSRPTPPSRLELNRPQTSDDQPPPIPTYISSKETQVYRPTPPQDDGFTLTPIEVAEFPEPPPAYTEVDVRSQRRDTVVDIPPPPTRVIVTGPNTAPTEASPHNRHRKIMYCPRCGARVHTLVVRQAGAVTHAIACILLMFCLLPIICLVYCMDCCKYRNHYCPNCNHLIGYEVLCQNTVYAK